MSYQIQSTKQHQNINTHLLHCQICNHSQIDIYLCKICLLFSCHSCTNNRICTNANQINQACQFQRIQQQNGLQIDLFNQSMEVYKKRFYESTTQFVQPTLNCQRCLITSATKQCLKCQIKNYCEQCFKMVHNSTKLQNHQLVAIKQNIQKTRKLRSKQTNLNLTTKIKSYDYQQIYNEKEKIISSMQANIDFLKASLMQEYNNYENQISKCINTINQQFQSLIEEVKLKTVQITMKIKQNLKDKYEKYQQKKQSIIYQQKILNNIKIIMNRSSQLQTNTIDNKIDACYEQITKIIRMNELNLNLSKDPIERKCQEVTQDIQQIRQSINKIQMKKNWLILDAIKTSMSISTPRGDKNVKALKGSVFINSARSQKQNPLTMSLITPKKLQGSNLKIQGQLDKMVTKLSFNEQQKVVHCPQDGQTRQKQFDPDKCLKFGTNKKKVKQHSIVIDTKMSLLSPKGPIKLTSGRNIDNNTKCKIAKGLNIQKSKKTIKQIQNELFKSQCNSNLTEEQQEYIISGRKQTQMLAPKTSRV